MITFLSLFLGIIVGTHGVEVQPSAEVVRVVVLLDGQVKADLRGEPWSAKVDFGVTLLPHKLEAVAFDDTGKESDRAVQWVNLIRSSAEASLSLELDPDGKASAVSVAWETVQGELPRSSRVELDGAVIEVEDIRRFELPRYDPNQLHFIRVELDFADEVVAVAEATFGGFYTDTVNTELTSIVIDIGGKRNVDLEDLLGSFRVAGEALDPVAVEKGSAEIVVVRDATAQPELRKIYSKIHDTHGRSAPDDFFVRHYWSRPRASVVGDNRYLLYPHSGDQSLVSRDLVSTFLIHGLQPENFTGSQLISGAAAVAGMASVSRNRRRAILVILGEPGADRSFIGPENIRSYFNAVDVPLEVWTTAADAWDRVENHGWGEMAEIDASWRMLRALDGVIERLQRQRVVWFSGRHLPQDIEVLPGAGFRRVGDGAAALGEMPQREKPKRGSRKARKRDKSSRSEL